MNNEEIAGLPKDLNLERLVAECLRLNADPHNVIALALTEHMRNRAEESGMTMKAQADLAWKLVDKANASQQSIKHTGEVKQEVRLIIEG
jgi:hypothetical protein